MTAEEKSDATLMQELRDGNDGALSILIERWQGPLLSFAFRYTQNQVDASDVAQETFVRVYQSRERYRPKGKFSTWLFTIAANLCRNRARWRKRHPSVPLEFPSDDGRTTDGEEWLEDERATSPDDSLLRGERIDAVKEVIGELPDDLKVALILFQYEGMSHQEIAEVAGCSPKAVETRLYRARGFLKKRLARFLRDDVIPGRPPPFITL